MNIRNTLDTILDNYYNNDIVKDDIILILKIFCNIDYNIKHYNKYIIWLIQILWKIYENNIPTHIISIIICIKNKKIRNKLINYICFLDFKRTDFDLERINIFWSLTGKDISTYSYIMLSFLIPTYFYKKINHNIKLCPNDSNKIYDIFKKYFHPIIYNK